MDIITNVSRETFKQGGQAPPSIKEDKDMKYTIKGIDKFNITYIRNTTNKEQAYRFMDSMLKVLKNPYVTITNDTRGVVIAEATKINIKGGC